MTRPKKPKEARTSPEAATLQPAPPAAPAPPEELDGVWNDGIAAAFLTLEPKQRNFLLAYLKEWNGAEAYRQAYNPLATNETAAACASRILTNASIGLILAKFANQKTEALFLVQKTYNDAAQNATKPIFGKDEDGQPVLVMDQPDHAVRVKAAEALAKLHGLNAADKVEHTGEITSKVVQVELPKKDAPA